MENRIWENNDFDGMSYALFGESSGKLRLGKEMRSTFADPSEATEVTLLFKHNEFLYELNRLPEQELLKTWHRSP